MLVIPDVAKIESLTRLIDAFGAYVHLYRNDIPLDSDTVITDFAESNYPGYVAQATSNWTEPVIVARRAQTSADPLLFTRTGTSVPQDVFGYYVTAGLSGPLLWCERGSAPPYPMRVPTDQVLILPRYSFRAEKRPIRTGL